MIPPLIAQNIDIFVCPVCGNDIRVSDKSSSLECSDCNRSFESENGIPLLFWPTQGDSSTDVTNIVKSFYEEILFPNYDDLDSGWRLREKAERGVFARLLDEQVPLRAKILEVGCGTGQLTNFLGMKWGRTVFGTDISLNSLSLGQRFKQENEIANSIFVQMNLFRPVFPSESFDLVVCNGVLHHTSDPFGGFQSISKLVKKGGHIIVGLYNLYGRVPNNLRSVLIKASMNRLKFLDSHLRDKGVGEQKKQAWYMDQYKHPHESKHTIGEVMRWFDLTDFEYVNGIPKATAFSSVTGDEQLFEKNPVGTHLDHFVVQAGLLLSGGREGGFFVMIGRKLS